MIAVSRNSALRLYEAQAVTDVERLRMVALRLIERYFQRGGVGQSKQEFIYPLSQFERSVARNISAFGM
jgi:hypothetical protein